MYSINLMVEFQIGDTVYLKTDPDQSPRLVTGYWVRPHATLYTLAYKDGDSTHFDFEISTTKTF